MLDPEYQGSAEPATLSRFPDATAEQPCDVHRRPWSVGSTAPPTLGGAV